MEALLEELMISRSEKYDQNDFDSDNNGDDDKQKQNDKDEDDSHGQSDANSDEEWSICRDSYITWDRSRKKQEPPPGRCKLQRAVPDQVPGYHSGIC